MVDALRRLRSTLRAERLTAGAAWQGLDDPAAPDGFVFTSRTGTLLEPRNLGRSFDRACREAGLKAAPDPNVPRGTKSGLSFHALRHDFASLLLATGVPGRVAAEMLGHSDYTLTASVYQHVPDTLQRTAASRLDAWLRSAVVG